MADNETKVIIKLEPALAPPGDIIPGLPDPGQALPKPPPFKPPVQQKKSLVFNIETTDLDPWEGRIISICFQDPEFPNSLPVSILLDDEADMIREFLAVYKLGQYTQLIGYGLSFDLRFMLLRAMRLNINIKEFLDTTLFDMMELMAKGRRSFIFFAQKPPNLSRIADFFFGFPKPFSDIQMQKFYAEGNFGKVLEFAEGQITRILLLYYLYRNVADSPIKTVGLGELSVAAPTTPG